MERKALLLFEYVGHEGITRHTQLIQGYLCQYSRTLQHNISIMF